jgi:ubiquinone/menaquinone biosynthesis C-methylase UbiE
LETEDWRKVVGTLESFTPYYEKVNLVATLMMLLRWRRAAANLVSKEDIVLEVGSGPGGFASLLDAKKVFCLDPSVKMLQWSRSHGLNGNSHEFVAGTGEHIPLGDDKFDKTFCIFSFRDFMDRDTGARELRRVLKKGGKAVVVDILKPESTTRKRIMDLWIKHGTRYVTRLMMPKSKDIWSSNPYDEFFRTYEVFETRRSLKALFERSGFEHVETKNLGLGAHMLVAGK